MDAISVTLAKPVELEGKTYSQLRFREPEVGDLLLADSSSPGIGQMVALLALISDVPLPAFKKIKGGDFKSIVAKTKPLLGNDPTNTTGE